MSLLNAAVQRGLKLNQTAAIVANNAFDRMFRAGELIKSNQTPFEVLLKSGPMTLRYYPPLEEHYIPLGDGSQLSVAVKEQDIPLIIVPPLAATALIFDLMPERSMVRYFRARGYKVYLVDWGEPGKKYNHLGIKDYVEDLLSEAINSVREHSGVQPISLLGWCMGGLFSLIYAGLSHDPNIKNIVTIASPIDNRQGGVAAGMVKALERPAYLIRKYTNFRVHKIDPKYLKMPGWANVLAFKLTNPIGSLTTYWDLLTRLWDREFVINHTTTSNFLDKMHDYPGGIVQDFFVKVGVDNDLSRGRMEIGDKVSEFDKIESSMLVFAGDTDAIVPPSVAQTSMNLVKSADKEFVIAPGGHAGVVMGGKAQRNVWAVAAEWLSTRSSIQATKPKKSAAK